MSVQLKFTIEGTRPLLMHSGRLADPLDPNAQALAKLAAKRAKTPADHAAISRAEWIGSLWLSDGRPCIPAEAIESCLVAAARTRRLGRAIEAAVACDRHAALSFDGPQSIDELWDNPHFRLRTGVCVARARVFRTRPRFPEWRAQISLTVLASVVDPMQVRDMLEIGGAYIGLGDWRPRYGRFRLI